MPEVLVAVLASGDGWHVQDLRRAARDLGHQAHTVSFRHFQSWIAFHHSDCAQSPTYTRIGPPFSRSPCTSAARVPSDGQATASATSLVSRSIDLLQIDRLVVRTMPAGSLEQVIFRMDVLHRLESTGIRILNRPRALETAVDKYLSCHRLERAGLRVPPTVTCENADAALEAFERFDRDVVVKPIFGSEGRGITRVTDADVAYRVFKTLEQLGAVLYLQRFVPHHGYDLRAFVLGDRVLAAMRRRHESDWRTNIARGAKGEPYHPSEAEVEIAIRAAGAVGADVAGVDLLHGLDGHTHVLEVNAVPGWRALATVTGVDVAREVLRFVE